MRVIPLTPHVRDAWDLVARESDEAWLYHGYDWCMDVNVGVWGYDSLSFLIADRDRIVGICPLFLRERRVASGLRFRFLSSGFGLTGPALINGLDPRYRAVALACVHAHVDALAREYGVVSVDFLLPPLALAHDPSHAFRDHPLGVAGFTDRSTSTYVVDLARSVDDLFMRLKPACRRLVRQAMRSRLSIRSADRPGDLERYYALHLETYRRTGARPHSLAYFDAIMRNGWANIFFAEHDGHPISAINVAVFKGSAAYWTGASATAFMHLRPANLLQWHAMQWAKDHGCRWYEVGEAFQHPTDEKQAGLTQFKGSFGGVLHLFHKYTKVYRPLHHRTYTFLQRAYHFLMRAASVV